MHYLIDLAKRVVEHKTHNPELHLFIQRPSIDKGQTGGVFVTIKKKGQLRGCIGKIVSHALVFDNVQEMALQAAFHDPRFPPIQESELEDLEYEVTILQRPTPVGDFSEIIIGKHGLIVESGLNRGLLLPQVAIEYGWDVLTFVKQTCVKAGLNSYAYQHKDTKIMKFEGEVIYGETNAGT